MLRLRQFVLMVLTATVTVAAVALTAVFAHSAVLLMGRIEHVSSQSRFLPDAVSALADMGIAIAALIVSFVVLIWCIRRAPVTLAQVFPQAPR